MIWWREICYLKTRAFWVVNWGFKRVINPESDFSLLSGRWNSRSASSQPCSGQTTVIQSKKAPPVQKKSTIFNYLKRWNSIRMIRSAALTKISSTATLYLPSCCLTVFDVGYLEKLASSNKRVLTWISPLLTFLNNLRLIGIQNLQWSNLCPTASYRILQKKEMEKSACYCL